MCEEPALPLNKQKYFFMPSWQFTFLCCFSPTWCSIYSSTAKGVGMQMAGMRHEYFANASPALQLPHQLPTSSIPFTPFLKETNLFKVFMTSSPVLQCSDCSSQFGKICNSSFNGDGKVELGDVFFHMPTRNKDREGTILSTQLATLSWKETSFAGQPESSLKHFSCVLVSYSEKPWLLLHWDTEMLTLPLRAFIDLLETGSNLKAFSHLPIDFHITPLKDYWILR